MQVVISLYVTSADRSWFELVSQEPPDEVNSSQPSANFIAIDSDYRIHVSDEPCAMNDGPMLEQGIKAKRGKILLMPDRLVDRPVRNCLTAPFEICRVAR